MQRPSNYLFFLMFFCFFLPSGALAVTEDDVIRDTTPIAMEHFGYAIDLDRWSMGTWAVIGAPGDTQGDPPQTNAGSASVWAYIVAGDWTGWAKFGDLVADSPALNSHFGSRVAISGDVVVVGAPDWGTDGYGAVYVYRFNEESGWEFEQRLTPTQNVTSQSNAGWSVDVSGDVIVIGAYYTNPIAPATFVYHYNGSTWVQQPNLPVGGNTRGVMVAVSGDVIATKPVLLGTLKVFRYAESSWTEEKDFGSTGNFSLHGDRLLIGEPGDDVLGENAGAAHVYRFNGSDDWVLEQTLRASDGEAGNLFGQYLKLNADRALIVAAGNQLPVALPYVFDFDGAMWQETAQLAGSDVVAGQMFAMGPLGIAEEVALIGAPNYTDEEIQDGIVFSYDVPEPGAGALALAALGTLILLKSRAQA